MIRKLDGPPIRALREFAPSEDGDLLAISCHATPLIQEHLYTEHPHDLGHEVHIYSPRTGDEVSRLPDDSLRFGFQPFPTQANETVSMRFCRRAGLAAAQARGSLLAWMRDSRTRRR